MCMCVSEREREFVCVMGRVRHVQICRLVVCLNLGRQMMWNGLWCTVSGFMLLGSFP